VNKVINITCKIKLQKIGHFCNSKIKTKQTNRNFLNKIINGTCKLNLPKKGHFCTFKPTNKTTKIETAENGRDIRKEI
jgi:hypothetical protein